MAIYSAPQITYMYALILISGILLILYVSCILMFLQGWKNIPEYLAKPLTSFPKISVRLLQEIKYAVL